ncbi:aldehyde dehydrogenase [Exophiala viscosa]|uniref:aldehyde dehydrogenase n=1 Tax=Exophiala viscosa TaxID=2486360 RepID=UPI00219768B4|nr:aldehyde dehydrogenase [Exophiala viscosa]
MGSMEKIETRLFINGKFVESSDGKTFPIRSPTTREVIAEVSEASEKDTDAAVAAAKAAFPAWSALSPDERGAYMKKLAALLNQNYKELSQLEAVSMGRPVSTYFDNYAAASTFEHYAEAGYEAQGISSLNTPGFVNMTFKQPYGVVAAIIPWNLPLVFFGNKVAPAIAAGNTVVLKSSEKAPLTSAKVAALIEQAGFPPGVINVLSGHGQTSGAILSSHMDVRALSFTGSCRTGRIIQAAAAKSNLKNVILELGGKSPAIIFEDSNLENAVVETQSSIQFNSGQVCMANSRIYVQDTIADKFVELFKSKFAAISAGDPLDPATNHGPQADSAQWDIVQKYLAEGKKAGDVALGGKTEVSGLSEAASKGYFVEPTIFLSTPEDAVVMKEEIFGPVVNINTFKTEEEVIAKANDSEFGLYAAVYTKDINRAMRFAKVLEAGTVGVNCTSPTVAKDMPFGGFKSSGTGREGLGHSLNNFLETKTVLMKINS